MVDVPGDFLRFPFEQWTNAIDDQRNCDRNFIWIYYLLAFPVWISDSIYYCELFRYDCDWFWSPGRLYFHAVTNRHVQFPAQCQKYWSRALKCPRPTLFGWWIRFLFVNMAYSIATFISECSGVISSIVMAAIVVNFSLSEIICLLRIGL